jgi:hypothetical protein
MLRNPNIAAREVPNAAMIPKLIRVIKSHHAWLAIGKFAPCSADENEASINKNNRSEDGRNEF